MLSGKGGGRKREKGAGDRTRGYDRGRNMMRKEVGGKIG